MGNLPIGSGLSEKQLSEFISSSMKQRGMLEQHAPDCVLSVWMSPEGTYAFVEFHTVEFANKVLYYRVQFTHQWPFPSPRFSRSSPPTLPSFQPPSHCLVPNFAKPEDPPRPPFHLNYRRHLASTASIC